MVKKSLDKYSREVMLALTSKDYKKAVNKYLLSYDLENWKIFTDNYFKLTPYEIELILDDISSKLDFHMIIDILSLAHIIGNSISLSIALIKLFRNINLSSYEDHIFRNVERLLKSPIAEERRIGLLMAGYFDIDEFFDVIERISNYDILFEDAYYTLGLMTNKRIVELLSTKFVFQNKNEIQRLSIAKILVQKGNPLAALWLYKRKEFDFITPFSRSIYLSRELVWMGIKPSLFVDSNDDFLQPITLKLINVISVILPYELELIEEIELENIIDKLLGMSKEEPSFDLIKTIYALKIALEELYTSIDPYSINKDIRDQIINSWNKLNKFPNNQILQYLKSYVQSSLNPHNEDFILALRIIRNFNLDEYEDYLLEIAKNSNLDQEQDFELISCLSQIGGKLSAEFIISKINQQVDFEKRSTLDQEHNSYHSDIDFIDDFNNELLTTFHKSFDLDFLQWFNADFNEIYYWNALYALGNIGLGEGIPILLEALDDYDPKIKFQAINSIKKISVITPEIEEKLVSLALYEQFMNVQREAIITLGKLNSQEAISLFIKIIFQAIEEGTLELAGEIDEIYDSRWEVDEIFDSPIEGQIRDTKEIGATPKVRESISLLDKNLPDRDIPRWINRLNSKAQKPIELREDLQNFDSELPEQTDFFNGSNVYDPSEIFPDSENIDDSDEEWLSELGEHFRKISIVESVIEGLKISNASIPMTEIKELIEHPVDEELYKDALIILAKTNDQFAINELIGLFDVVDFTRAREIAKILKKIESSQLEKISKKIYQSPDWIIKRIMTEQQND